MATLSLYREVIFEPLLSHTPRPSWQGEGGRERDLRSSIKRDQVRASLVAQWLRICLPMQGTRVRALVWEDPTCRGATRPVSHNC